jgi:hypothetical protein
MADCGYVTVDREDKPVEPGPRFDARRPVLAIPNGHDDAARD